MRWFLIKIVFRLLNPFLFPRNFVESKALEEFFAMTFITKHFRDYIHKRDMEILQQMGEGVSEKRYQELVGQRIEVGQLLTYARKCFEKVKKYKPNLEKNEKANS